MEVSPSEFVFPRLDGSMMREDVDIENVLQPALARAGSCSRASTCADAKAAAMRSSRRTPSFATAPNAT